MPLFHFDNVISLDHLSSHPPLLQRFFIACMKMLSCIVYYYTWNKDSSYFSYVPYSNELAPCPSTVLALHWITHHSLSLSLKLHRSRSLCN